jgi:hypothetical protein
MAIHVVGSECASPHSTGGSGGAAAVDSSPDARGFVVAAVCSCFGLLALVLTLNLLVDPFAIAGTGLVPTAVESDRAAKLNLIDDLEAAPEILVLGSSRARLAEPAFLDELTGHGGFNAGVTSGTAADAWAFTRYTADRFPGTTRRYVWFVDVGIAGRGVNPQLAADDRTVRYLDDRPGQFGLNDVGTYLSPEATRASIRVLRSCVLGSCESKVAFRADGSIPRPRLRYLPEHEENVKAAAAALASTVWEDASDEATQDPARYDYFERAIAFMNARGERPVIVLNPIHPTVLAALERKGFTALERSTAYLQRLRERGFDFVVVNCQDIRTWGGRAEDFTNPTHVNRNNMRRVLRYVVAHSEGALA